LRLDRSLLGLAHLLDPCSARLLGGLGLGTEGVDLPFELAGVYAEPAQRLAGERVRGAGKRDQEIADVGLSLELAADPPR
jgi:hypothetical protein